MHEVFPYMEEGSRSSAKSFGEIAGRLTLQAPLDCLAVTMTAELSDVYQTKREGVN
ncbi:hypothetical protein KEJ15_05650, partial [Candidatus Bathyarchaeota archaeon]|nr:hypothetical protein [Candidatus Bathyarchaeota archaeon]